jgi:endonuclease/exonuclease/phosphatase family metal-dependent hydrolase
MRSFFALSLALFTITLGYGVENSIIPLMEKFECVENLPWAKYSANQAAEILNALKDKESKIRLATYNMLFPLYDHNLDQVNRWPCRLPRIVEMVQEMRPDILCVQELYDSQVKDLMAILGKEFEFYAKPCADGEQNGIFYKKERFKVLDSHVWYMTPTPKIPSSETLTLLKLKDRKTGESIAIFNTHFAFSNINKREFQARFAADVIEKYAEKMPVIFTGDLNTFAHRLDLGKLPFYDGDYVHRILTSGSLRNSIDLSVLGHLGPISTFTNVNQDPIAFQGTGTPGVFLDHIYASSGITVLMHAVEPGTVEGHFPSDHMPVVMDFLVR